ncbi:choice-of-anchor J domain-containing protein [Marinilabilia sp.]|uniref:choice-of-anchor J domain-containing protein n=1 Tax=Marinilabilia sp. TaxID=2021252 RepID=UPI0025C4B0CA|nr:choice-of-anchor J domain-containing protein [Marinilabilia sp.]
MKKLLYILASSMFLLWSCEPLEDTYEELDKEQGAYSEDISVTLADDDYSTLSTIAGKLGNSDASDFIGDNLAFNEQYPAADFIPSFLGETFVALNKDSRAIVNYNFMQGNPDYIGDYELTYKLDSADYAGAETSLGKLKAFSPAYPPENYMSGLLEGEFADSPDGSIAYASYRVSDMNPEELGDVSPLIFREDFNGSLGDFSSVSVSGDQQWRSASYNDDQYAIVSGYSGGAQENEDWLISPEIDLSEYETAYFVVRQAVNYLDNYENIQIMVSNDFDGADVTTATWTEMTIETKPAGTGWSFVESEEIDLVEFKGESIHIAFRYRSTTSGAATWEVDWLSVETKDAKKPKYTYFDEFFMKDGGEWHQIVEDDFEDGVYVLSVDDYDSMGEPGNHDNFSSSVSPEEYLPVFLSINRPYAQEGEQLIVVFKYYSNRVTFSLASEYVFNGTEWQNSARIVERSEQFVHNGSKWVFDPTVVFTMTTPDYQLIVDYVKTEIDGGADYLNSYKTGEYYFGADAYYENFDLRLSNRTEKNVPGFEGLSTEDAVALTYERLTEAVEVMLMEKYPDATAQVNGVDVHYIITVETYENDLSRGLYTFNFKCVKSGPNPEFELVEAPEF